MGDRNAVARLSATNTRAAAPVGDIQDNAHFGAPHSGANMRAAGAEPRMSERANSQDQSDNPVKRMTAFLAQQGAVGRSEKIKNLAQVKVMDTAIALAHTNYLISIAGQQSVQNKNGAPTCKALPPGNSYEYADAPTPWMTHLSSAVNGSAEFYAVAVAPTHEQSIANCSAYPPCNLL